MTGRMLKKDLLRNKVITLTLFVLVMLAALPVASAAGIIMELLGSVDSLYANASAPHFVQMHAGESEYLIEEDYREIGVMKVIGIQSKEKNESASGPIRPSLSSST